MDYPTASGLRYSAMVMFILSLSLVSTDECVHNLYVKTKHFKPFIMTQALNLTTFATFIFLTRLLSIAICISLLWTPFGEQG